MRQLSKSPRESHVIHFLALPFRVFIFRPFVRKVIADVFVCEMAPLLSRTSNPRLQNWAHK